MTKKEIYDQIMKHKYSHCPDASNRELYDLIEQICTDNYLVDKKALSERLVPIFSEVDDNTGMIKVSTALNQVTCCKEKDLDNPEFNKAFTKYIVESFGYNLEHLPVHDDDQISGHSKVSGNKPAESSTSKLIKILLTMDTPDNLVKMMNLLRYRGLDSYESVEKYFERTDLQSDRRMNEALDEYYRGSKDRLL